MPNCAVKGCRSWNMRMGFKRHIRFFSFPRDEEIKKLWIQACNKPDFSWKNARICSLHFTDDDWCLKDKLLNTDRSKCTLDKKAVPTQNLRRNFEEVYLTEMDSLEEDTSYSIVDDNDAEIEECDIKLEDVEIHDQDEAQVMESYSPPRKKSLASTPPIRLRKDLRAIPATEFCLASIQSSASKDVAPQLPDVTISGNEQKFSPAMIDRSPSLCSETGRTNERWSFQPDADYSSCTGLCRKREHEANNLEKSIIKLQKTIDSKLEQDKDDEFDLFGKSIAIQLKRMPLERALRCQESLQRVMNQERLQQNK